MGIELRGDSDACESTQASEQAAGPEAEPGEGGTSPENEIVEDNAAVKNEEAANADEEEFADAEQEEAADAEEEPNAEQSAAGDTVGDAHINPWTGEPESSAPKCSCAKNICKKRHDRSAKDIKQEKGLQLYAKLCNTCARRRHRHQYAKRRADEEATMLTDQVTGVSGMWGGDKKQKIIGADMMCPNNLVASK